MIYHLINKEKWNKVKSKVYYRPKSVDREGYIHCSYDDQLLKVAESFHRGEEGLLVLCINEQFLGDMLRSEDLFNLNEKYPHVYGELPIKSIEKVVPLEVNESGDFIKPNLESISTLVVEQGEWT
ncbi:DUF952 domain-containing protein [Thiospirochaeta perfilievii]|uniref:DUF952 domain-containing protein n=1 Tax=Thiospirochaeta perfilievii TaxID=252967 RepID=A0A5C1QAN3_9SPIO|nr:DUF952 domain-containing protein [Thiospirochaeta perfilievii]QEN05183.1 DUF952 domain-containing protein [Thiospirochaeta perfilievii]